MAYPIATLLSGLPRTFKLGWFLTEWSREDPDAALAWPQRAELVEIAELFPGLILCSLAEVNPEDALDRSIAMNQGSNASQVSSAMEVPLLVPSPVKLVGDFRFFPFAVKSGLMRPS